MMRAIRRFLRRAPSSRRYRPIKLDRRVYVPVRDINRAFLMIKESHKYVV